MRGTRVRFLRAHPTTSSADESTTQSANSQENTQQSGENAENGEVNSTLSQTSDQVSEQVVDRYTLNSAGNSTQMQKDMEALRKSNREEYSKIQPAYEL